MQIFVTGTDTDVGKTIVSSWLCLHTGSAYFKPIQTGNIEGTDSNFIKQLNINNIVYPEIYNYKAPLSPHLAARLENEIIDINKINLPANNDLIIEGAGGLLVPINKNYLMIDLINKFSVPVILVARANLGTINHTLLSLEALRARDIGVLGVILTDNINIPEQNVKDNIAAIELYGNTKVLAYLPRLDIITKNNLLTIELNINLLKNYAFN